MRKEAREKNQSPLLPKWQKMPFCHIWLESLDFKILVTLEEEIVFESLGFKYQLLQIFNKM